jgi:hypothetical protein
VILHGIAGTYGGRTVEPDYLAKRALQLVVGSRNETGFPARRRLGVFAGLSILTF